MEDAEKRHHSVEATLASRKARRGAAPRRKGEPGVLRQKIS